MKKLDIIFVILIILATLFAWHGIINRSLNGDGFFYFSPTSPFFSPGMKFTEIISRFDNFPRLFHFIFEPIFKGNMQLYMASTLVIITLVNLTFYLFVKKVTQNPYLGFLAAIYAGVNYTAGYTFYANGTLNWIGERVAEAIPIFISFWLLDKYIKSKKINDYLLSLLLFTLAVLMAHFSIFLLPFIPAYLLVISITKTKGNIRRIKTLALGIPFIIISYLIVSGSTMTYSSFHTNQTLLQSFIPSKEKITQISFQLVVSTIPFNLLQFIKMHLSINYDYKELVLLLITPVYLLYLIIFVYLSKIKSKYLDFSLASFIALIGTLFLNVFVNNRFNVYGDIERGRYLFLPAFFVGIILSSFIVSVLKYFKIYPLLIMGTAILWFTVNTNMIWRNIRNTQYSHTGGIMLLNKLNDLKNKLPDNAVVILPTPIMPCGGDFLTKFYSGNNTRFFYLDSKWKDRLQSDFDPEKLFVFDYNNKEIETGPGEKRLDKIRVIDNSEDYRKSLAL